MFELSFRDERLLPFEGVGAHVSTGDQWQFVLSKGNRFSYLSVDDMVLEVRYTARPGRLAVDPHPGRTLKRLVRVRDEFPDAWQAFVEGAPEALLEFELPQSTWPLSRNETLAGSSTVGALRIFGTWVGEDTPTMQLWVPGVTPPLNGDNDLELTGGDPVGEEEDSARVWTGTAAHTVDDGDQTWAIKPSDKGSLKDVWIVFEYAVDVEP
jgi:hypothetical protein